jgi:hypothetical protein
MQELTEMQILCPEKDFYDFKAYEWGHDKTYTYDRRKFVKITDSLLISKFRYDKRDFYSLRPKEFVWFILEVGLTQYLFKITNLSIHWKEGVPKDIESAAIDFWSGDFELAKVFDENLKFLNAPIGLFGHYGVDHTNVGERLSRWKYRYVDEHADLTTWNLQELAGYPKNEKLCILNPLLKESKIPSFVSPEQIYRNLEAYFSFEVSDKMPPVNVTDKEKAFNHGFSPRESFRNIHPRKD